ncbi:hypothetical protein LSH36_68g04040 [Paralvinella palmiformis]|uniref:Uncharacterized protein n=1 Tax=Paralvinella palmiformis TaxID=53620 RepID=A0AAD9ND28_9ANNE|nr:hypothetical protein LSH36_68g04040 [Paralvinella palmiformis]
MEFSLYIYMFTVLFSYFVISQCDADNLSRGFNDDISWVGYKDGLNQAKSYRYNFECYFRVPANTTLENQFYCSYISLGVVLVKDDEENELPDKGRAYQPDGGYIPRILFLGRMSDVLPICDKVVKSMKKAMELMPASSKDKEL